MCSLKPLHSVGSLYDPIRCCCEPKDCTDLRVFSSETLLEHEGDSQPTWWSLSSKQVPQYGGKNGQQATTVPSCGYQIQHWFHGQSIRPTEPITFNVVSGATWTVLCFYTQGGSDQGCLKPLRALEPSCRHAQLFLPIPVPSPQNGTEIQGSHS